MHWRTRRDKGRFRTQAEGRHVHLSTGVKVFPPPLPSRGNGGRTAVAVCPLVRLSAVSRRPGGGARSIVEDNPPEGSESENPRAAPPSWNSPTQPSPSPRNRGNANARNTRCSCSASIPEPCTRLVSRRLPLLPATVDGSFRSAEALGASAYHFATVRPASRAVAVAGAGRVYSGFMWHSYHD